MKLFTASAAICAVVTLCALPAQTMAQGACSGKEDILPGGAVLADGLCAQIYLKTDQLVNEEARPRSLQVMPSNEVFLVQRAGEYEGWETLTGYVTVLDDPSGVGAKVEQTVLVNMTSLDHGLAVTDTHVYASNAYGVYRWPYQVGQREPLTDMEVVITNIPNGTLADQLHPTRTIMIDQDNFLFLATGSVYNIDNDAARANIQRFDLNNAQLPMNWGEDGLLVAEGTRNTVGITKDRFNVLWGVDNGYDHPYREDLGGDINEENPADEVNVFPEAMWGSFYGYPYCFTEWMIPEDFGGGGPGFQWVLGNFSYPDSPYSDEFCRDENIVVPPALALETHSAPLSITFYEYKEAWPEDCPPGVAFPQEWDGDAFITYHGSYYREEPTGAKVMRIPMTDDGQVDGPIDMEIFPIMEDPAHNAEWLSGIRPVDVKFDNCGRLLVSSDGSYEDQDGRMVIMVQSNPPPRNLDFPVPERPEGITEGPGSTLFVSQILSGKVLALDVLTNETIEVVGEQDGDRQSWGLWYYKDHLFVAGGGPSFGGGTVEVHVYDAATGTSIVSCAPLTTNEFGAFLNDVTVLNSTAYITDSVNGMLMAMNADVAIAGSCDVWEVELPENFAPTEQDDFGANGVVPYGEDGLLVSHEIDGSVWYISNLAPDDAGLVTPSYQEVIPDGEALFADGLTVDGDMLYVTQNFGDTIGVFELDDALVAAFLGNLSSPDFATPATSAIFDGYIYSTNSRFETLEDISAPADDNVVGVALNSLVDTPTTVTTSSPAASPTAENAVNGVTAAPSSAKGRPTSITAPPMPAALPTMPTAPSLTPTTAEAVSSAGLSQTEWTLTIGFGISLLLFGGFLI